MTDSQAPGSPLEAAVGAASPAATEPLKLVSNETRMAILLPLWEHVEPFEEANGLSFSALRERVGMRDSGQFSHHLEKLVGSLVEETDAGCELRDRGLRLVQTVIGGAATENTHLDPTPIDITCGLCGGDVEVSYDEGWVFSACTGSTASSATRR